jgi:short-subunit dehydrogenase
MLAAYAASKSAAWSFTNALRIQLRQNHVQVLALHVGFLDTDLTKDFDVPKSSPEAVVKLVYAGLESGKEEVLADEGTRFIKSTLSNPDAIYFNPPMPG